MANLFRCGSNQNSNLGELKVVCVALAEGVKTEIPIDISKVKHVTANWATAKYCYYGECDISNGVITNQVSKDLVKNINDPSYFAFYIENGKLYIKQGFNNVTYNVGVYYI